MTAPPAHNRLFHRQHLPGSSLRPPVEHNAFRGFFSAIWIEAVVAILGFAGLESLHWLWVRLPW
jgi:hypothetical protein